MNLWQNRHNPASKHKLRSFVRVVSGLSGTLVLAWACWLPWTAVNRLFAQSVSTELPAPSAAPGGPAATGVPAMSGDRVALGDSVPGQPLLARSARLLGQHRSFEARLRQRSRLFGQTFVGSGVYRQLAAEPQPLWQWDLKLDVGGQVTSLRQTSDGRYQWIHRNFPQRSELAVIDLRRVRDAQAAASPAGGSPSLAPAAGGLAELLQGLDQFFDFPVARSDKLGEHDIWVLEGTWKPAQLVRLLPEQKSQLLAGQPPSGERLPPHLPQRVRLVLGRDPVVPLFPYRIEYLRQASADKSPSPGGAGEWQVLLVVEFFEIRRVPLVPQQFQYDPGDNSILDETDQYLERHGLMPGKASGGR